MKVSERCRVFFLFFRVPRFPTTAQPANHAAWQPAELGPLPLGREAFPLSRFGLGEREPRRESARAVERLQCTLQLNSMILEIPENVTCKYVL